MGRFSTAIGPNLKKGFSKDALIGDALTLVAPLLYWGLPTMLGLNGYTGLAVAFSVPYLLGKALNVPEWSHAAVAIGASHVIQANQDVVVNVLNKPLWTLEEPIAGLAAQPGAYIDSFNGRPVVAYPGAGGDALSGFQRLTPGDLSTPEASLPAQPSSLYLGNGSSATRSLFANN